MLPSVSNAPVQETSEAVVRLAEQPLNRACDACRLSKVRCLANPDTSSSMCQRCAKTGKQCVFAPPAKRRQRKRTDVRVAELEREVKQLTSLLKPDQSVGEESNDSIVEDDDTAATPEGRSSVFTQAHQVTVTPATKEETELSCRSRYEHGSSEPRMSSPESLQDDIIERGIITGEQAEELLHIYRFELCPHFPTIMIPLTWTWVELRRQKPVLFLAVMAAASHCKGATLSDKLQQETIHLYARVLFINGEKSIEYIQALFVTVAYYSPSLSPAQTRIYMLGNMAASMALEIGLASKPRTHEQLPKRALRSLQKISSPEELLDNCRTVLALYTLTAGLAIRLRRPNILLYNSWMEECQRLLAKSPAVSDKRIIAWLRMQRIADEAYTAFGFDDASTSFTLSELRLQAILKIFEKKMQDWKKSIPDDVMTLTLTVEYHQNMMSMWDFAMDGGRYDAPEFRNRHLTLPALDDDSSSSVQPESLLSRSALQINATVMCISSAHTVLNCFLQTSIAYLQQCPGVVFIRAIFALVILLKADYAIGTDAEGIGEVLDSQSLKVDFYVEQVRSMMREAVGEQQCRLPSHWLYVLEHKVKAWHDEHQRWRRCGGHLKRNGTVKRRRANSSSGPRDAVDTRNTDTLLASALPPERVPPATLFYSPNPNPNSPHQHSQQQRGGLPPPPQDQSAPSSFSPAPTNARDSTTISSAFPWNPRHIASSVASSAAPITNIGTSTKFAPLTSVPASASVSATESPSAAAGATSGSTSMLADFSAAFSQGDLYLWNDLGGDDGGVLGGGFGFGVGLGGVGFGDAGIFAPGIGGDLGDAVGGGGWGFGGMGGTGGMG